MVLVWKKQVTLPIAVQEYIQVGSEEVWSAEWTQLSNRAGLKCIWVYLSKKSLGICSCI